MLIILSICCVSLKFTITNSQLGFHYYFLCSFNSSRYVAICIVALAIKSTLGDHLIVWQWNPLCPQTFFLTELLLIARSTREFPSNLQLIFWSKTFTFFDCTGNVVLVICTLTFEPSFGHYIILFRFKLFSCWHFISMGIIIIIT